MRRKICKMICITLGLSVMFFVHSLVFAETSPSTITKLDAPKLTIMNVAATGKPSLSWNKVSKADSYTVFWASAKKGPYKELVTTTKTSVIHDRAIGGKQYYYKVQAISKSNPELNSQESAVKMRTCDLRRPVCKVDLNKNGKPKLTWKAIPNAEKYEIYRAYKAGGPYERIATTKSTSHVHKKAAYHKTYYYKVKAIDADQKQAASAKSKSCSVYTINLRKKLVALTFDDGPGPYTKKIVNCLKKNNGRATFYVLGQRVKSYPSALKSIHAGGNEIGNHSYNHPMLYNLSGKEIRSQMNRTDKLIKNLTGLTPATMRPPGGGVDTLVRKNVGKPMILWSIDTRDWETRSKSATINHVIHNVSDGDIVLMHDIHEPTMEAALVLIPKLRKQGYELVTVSELAKYRGVKMKNGKSYYEF